MERAIRSVTLGRKNSLFVGSESRARRWAISASLIETAKLDDVEPWAWLRDLLVRMAGEYPNRRLDELMPRMLSSRSLHDCAAL